VRPDGRRRKRRLGRVAALADIHGNLPALDAVLAEVERAGVDIVVSGGDVAAGPMPVECVDRLLELGDRLRWVRGNADREPVPPVAAEVAAFTAALLGERRRRLLADAPTTTELEIAGLGRVCFCHGSPRSDEEILTKLSPPERVAAALAATDAPLVVGGHTHVQFDREVAGRRLVNAGSVGMPYEGRRGAFWALLGPDVELRRTEYDVEAAVATIRETGYPQAEELAGWLLEPRDPNEVSAYFEGHAAT
jgi:putative phosphoesterase